jgi:hypothetical protein
MMAATLSSTSTPRFSSNTSWLINPRPAGPIASFPMMKNQEVRHPDTVADHFRSYRQRDQSEDIGGCHRCPVARRRNV